MTLDFPFLQFLCWHGYFRYVKRFKVNLDNSDDLMFFWFYISLKKYYPPLNWLMFRMNGNVKWGYYTTFLWVSWKSCKSCIYTFWMRVKICIICFSSYTAFEFHVGSYCTYKVLQLLRVYCVPVLSRPEISPKNVNVGTVAIFIWNCLTHSALESPCI